MCNPKVLSLTLQLGNESVKTMLLFPYSSKLDQSECEEAWLTLHIQPHAIQLSLTEHVHTTSCLRKVAAMPRHHMSVNEGISIVTAAFPQSFTASALCALPRLCMPMLCCSCLGSFLLASVCLVFGQLSGLNRIHRLFDDGVPKACLLQDWKGRLHSCVRR